MNIPNRLNKQVVDDWSLLKQMMSDMEQADELYQPTNYWKHYEKIFLPELKKIGLYDFRSRYSEILPSFGASDRFLEKLRITPKVKFPGTGRIARWLERILCDRSLFKVEVVGYNANAEWVISYFYHYVQKRFQLVNLDLNTCPTSLFGNPQDIVEIKEGYWSLIHLCYCSIVADAAQYIGFGNGMYICELGSGMGRNIEILAKLFPKGTLLSIDIPPQLYVSHQYLSAVFGERVVPYQKAILLEPDKINSFKDSIRGKILIMPTWIMPKWQNFKINLFWNSASFQEMEPYVVKNYLKLVKKMSPKYIYINARPEGNYWGKWKPGRGGTKEPVLSQYYIDFLRDKYKLIVEYETDYFLQIKDYKSYIFEISENITQ